MSLLVINAGSSSLKFALFNLHLHEILRGRVERIGKNSFATISHQKISCKAKDHLEALEFILGEIKRRGAVNHLKDITVVSHRVVHGGTIFQGITQITPLVIKQIKSLIPLAPLHNPANLTGILATQTLLPQAKQYAMFDTSFHHSIPEYAYLYGIPYETYQAQGIRKFGFHGINHEYVYHRLAYLEGRPINIISCHLGNGSSITAIKKGKSVDTTMGYSPIDGVLMGTRSGALDPSVVLHLLAQNHFSINEMNDFLNSQCGLKGISGVSSDLRDIYNASPTNKRAELALTMLAYSIAKFISSFFGVLGKVDAISFSGGIGENAYYLREAVCEHLSSFGISIDDESNKGNKIIISRPRSTAKLYVVPAHEEFWIAKKTVELVQAKP
ncbi:MAG: acetate/propionate family kinase [Candidatus Woesearchaeota archaeon]|nr:MAG: acetate/propionate family kinase [Candidatus Woesearchaeota archaeon]